MLFVTRILARILSSKDVDLVPDLEQSHPHLPILVCHLRYKQLMTLFHPFGHHRDSLPQNSHTPRFSLRPITDELRMGQLKPRPFPRRTVGIPKTQCLMLKSVVTTS